MQKSRHKASLHLSLTRSFIQREAETWGEDPALAGFYRWQAEALREVKVTRRAPKARGLAKALEQFETKRGPAQASQCFENALALTRSGAECGVAIGYVEGYLLVEFSDGSRMIYSHAWNTVGGRHFDLTAAANMAACGSRIGDVKWFYFQIADLDAFSALYFDGIAERELQIPYYCGIKGLKLNTLERGWNIIENKAGIT